MNECANGCADLAVGPRSGAEGFTRKCVGAARPPSRSSFGPLWSRSCGILSEMRKSRLCFSIEPGGAVRDVVGIDDGVVSECETQINSGVGAPVETTP